MVGLVLDPEQIRSAPLEVRLWLEQQIAQTFKPRATPNPPTPHIVACTLEQAGGILEQIEGSLPIIRVFFELGREQASFSQNGLRVLGLAEVARRAHLPNTDMLLAALRIIDDAFKRIIGDPQATLYALDPQGHCYVADGTARSILSLWHGMASAEAFAPQPRTESPERSRSGSDG